ncbi:MAG: redox-sensing transcriptional repressor Rex [Lachnospiraceae bacterium]|jgi:redox-sensing transcriptional repressor|nr:redox-sensing transcriptional repressor Rex [Lachnospiraceae bacterium]
MVVEEKEISQAVVGRLPRYLRYLGELRDEGIERVSSQELSDIMQVTASQIRQDLNTFGGFGQQGYGYNVGHLYDEIGKILGLNREHRLIIVGAGHLGQALVNYSNFERRGFLFCGLFDSDPKVCGKKIRSIAVRPMEEMAGFIRDHNIDIAVLTIPKNAAVETAEQLAACGIKGIWNFAHVDLRLPGHIQVENVHLSDSLMKLSYNLSSSEEAT